LLQSELSEHSGFLISWRSSLRTVRFEAKSVPPFFCIRTFAAAVHKEMCQSLPGALFFAAAPELPVLVASVPSFDDRIQRWFWWHHTFSVQCLAAAARISCSLAHPACFLKALRTLFVHTELAVLFPFSAPYTSCDLSSHPNFCCHQKFPVPPPPTCQVVD
jgi:hypothetical protein